MISLVLITILIIWMCVLSVIVFKIQKFFNSLSKDIQKDNLVELLIKISQKEEINSKAISLFSKEIARFEKEEKKHFQKYGFIRFNPFNDMGGDHSFSLALLDSYNTGFILTGLHSRDRTRIYIKNIKRGKSEYDLSNEERKSLESALKN